MICFGKFMPGLLQPRRFLFKKIKEIRICLRECSEGETIRGSHAGFYRITDAKCVERHRNTHGPPRVARR
jgi:hypothetical protein